MDKFLENSIYQVMKLVYGRNFLGPYLAQDLKQGRGKL